MKSYFSILNCACCFRSILVGLAFGGIWSSFPVVVDISYPGTKADYSFSLGITMFAASLGTLVVGQLTTIVLNATSLDDLARSGYFWTFIFFLLMSIVSTALAVALGSTIKPT